MYEAIGYLGGPNLRIKLIGLKDAIFSEYEDERLDLDALIKGI